MITKVQSFLSEVMVEMKKVSWTSRQDVLDSTLIVILSAVMLGVFIAGVDFLLSKGISVLIK